MCREWMALRDHGRRLPTTTSICLSLTPVSTATPATRFLTPQLRSIQHPSSPSSAGRLPTSASWSPPTARALRTPMPPSWTAPPGTSDPSIHSQPSRLLSRAWSAWTLPHRKTVSTWTPGKKSPPSNPLGTFPPLTWAMLLLPTTQTSPAPSSRDRPLSPPTRTWLPLPVSLTTALPPARRPQWRQQVMLLTPKPTTWQVWSSSRLYRLCRPACSSSWSRCSSTTCQQPATCGSTMRAHPTFNTRTPL